MQYRKVGRSGLKISAAALGTGFFGSHTGEADANKIMDIAFEKGINLFDTANSYAGGRSEEIVRKFIKNKRAQIVLATKVGQKQGKGPNDNGLSREHILQGVEASLKRLDTNYIDIYYAHVPDYTTPLEETLRAFDDLVKQGKVRYIACANFLVWQLMKAQHISDKYDLPRFDIIQIPYNLLTRDIEPELIPCCAGEGTGVTAYNPLAGGLLTGKHSPDKPPAPNTRFSLEGIGPRDQERYWSAANFTGVEHLKKIADAHGCSMAQFSVAWVLNNPVITSVILGVSSARQLEENMGAVDIKLTAEEMKACDVVWDELRPPRIFYGR
jgi:aryl-alcohol dehydrogenase-like predicted oxidoreductase